LTDLHHGSIDTGSATTVDVLESIRRQLEYRQSRSFHQAIKAAAIAREVSQL
jgi:hypothetical protein